jgi:H+/gluconate symporter-like permease
MTVNNCCRVVVSHAHTTPSPPPLNNVVPMEDKVKQLTGPSWLPSILSMVFVEDALLGLPEEEAAEEEEEEEEEKEEDNPPMPLPKEAERLLLLPLLPVVEKPPVVDLYRSEATARSFTI